MSRQTICEAAAILLMTAIGGSALLASDNRHGSRAWASATSRTGSPAARASAGACDANESANEDCNGNGVADMCDIDSGDSTDCDVNGVPDECQWVERDPLPTAGESESAFGGSVARDGDVAIVGDAVDGDVAPFSGSATMFRYDGAAWLMVQKLKASDAAASDLFGKSVSIDGDLVLVGAPLANDVSTNDGAAYLFRRSEAEWSQEARLTAGDASLDAQFGSSVAVRGNLAVVGAEFKDDLITNSGAAYVFRYDGTRWVDEGRLVAPGAGRRAKFGHALAIGVNTILVGAPLDDVADFRIDAGAVYVYQFDGGSWNETAKFTASDAGAGDHFGTSVSLHNDTAVIGASRDDDGAQDSGAAYVFRFDGSAWREEQKLAPSDKSIGKLFGSSVSAGPNVVVIGAEGDAESGGFSGAAYVFRYFGSKWSQENRFVADDLQANDLFGRSVAVGDNNVLVGAEGASAVYAFVIPDADCNENGAPDFCDIVTGTSSDCNDNRVPDDCEPDCNGDGVPDECEQGDCNGNGVLDTCDIAAGESVDCDGNLIPDECEPDCNGNGIVDACDISSGVSSDCDENGVPDSCQWLDQRPYIGPLVEFDGERDNDFGRAVATGEDVVLIGSEDAAFVFRLIEHHWVEEQVLRDRSVAGNINFGSSVSVDGNLAAVGAPWDNDVARVAGATYLYRFDGIEWDQEAKLAPVSLERGDRFGESVSVSGDVVLIGASGTNDTGMGTGAAYVFRFDGIRWAQEAMLTASEGRSGFGFAVSLKDDVALVGALAIRTTLLFRYDGAEWLEDARLTQPDSDTELSYGRSVAIDGNIAVIGARSAAYVFRQMNAGWTLEAKLVPSSLVASTRFASTVSISGNTLVVGDAEDRSAGIDVGAAFVYRFNGNSWAEESSLAVPSRRSIKKFGAAVAVNNDRVIVGAPSDTSGDGSVFVFEPFAADCNENGVIDNCELANGDVSDCNGNIVPDECEADCNHNGIPDTCEISDGKLTDCNSNLVPDICDLATGSSDDCNANNVPDECDADCNDNRVVDECEIAQGDLVDCDDNLVPDACQFIQRTKLTASGLEQDAFFGGPVSLSGNVLVVGMTATSSNNLQSKSAVTYRFDGRQWIEEQALRSPNQKARDGFGVSVSVDGGVALVGAPGDDAVYAFRHDGSAWVEEARMTEPEPAFPGLFGWHVSVHGNWAVIGAPFRGNSGAAYVFGFDGNDWVFETELVPSRVEGFARYGISVAVDGDAILVGASRDSAAESGAGSVFVFRYDGSGWTEEAKFVASDARTNDRFGASVALRGDAAWIGAPGAKRGRGAAYAYRFNGTRWVERARVSPDDLEESDRFGVSVSFFDDVALVGATFGQGEGIQAGAAYVFRLVDSRWIEESKLLPIDARGGEVFGLAVALNERFAFIGAPYENGVETREGVMYIFDLPGGDCNANGSSDLCDISEGDSLDCNGDSIPDECEIGPDSDGDGVFDDCDACPDSDATPLLVVNGCNSRVPNQTLITGCTMADELATCEEVAGNRGRFVSCVTRQANGWKRDGLLADKGIGRIVSCAATGHDTVPPTQRRPAEFSGRKRQLVDQRQSARGDQAKRAAGGAPLDSQSIGHVPIPSTFRPTP